MGVLFSSVGFKEFVEIMQKQVRSTEELLGNIRKAMVCVEEEMHIGKLTLELSVPETKVRGQRENFSGVLYQRDGVFGHNPIVNSYRTGDGGTVILTFYARDGYTWNSDELEEIRILSNLVYNAFKVENMNTLLDKAITTDLAVGIPNIAGFMRFASEKYVQGILDRYIGVYFNIHNFKYVNNVLSHVKADGVMALYVNTLKKAVEREEIVARLGGDNFVALILEENVDRFIDLEIKFSIHTFPVVADILIKSFADALNNMLSNENAGRYSLSTALLIHKSAGERKDSITH